MSFSTRLNRYGRFWTNLLGNVLHHQHPNQMRDYILEKWCPPLQQSSDTEGLVVAHNLTETIWVVFFPFNLPTVSYRPHSQEGESGN